MKGDRDVVLVGGVGTGRIFQWAHLRVYPHLLAKARLVGFYDVDQSRAREACDKYTGMLEECVAEHPEQAEAAEANISRLRCYPTLEEMLEDVDLVDVCTHARDRMDIAIAALEKGVHSMVEKPMARTWIEADRAVRAFAERPDVYCQLNDDNVFDPRYRTLHDLVAHGVIGEARPLSTVPPGARSEPGPESPAKTRDRRSPAVQSMWLSRGSRLDSTTVLKSQASALDNGGGCLMDYGSHGLAGSWYVLGMHLRPVKVEAVRIGVLFPNRVLEGEPVVVEVDDNAQIKVLMEDPGTGSWTTVFLEASWTGGHIGPPDMRTGEGGGGFLRIEGDEGVINGSARDRLTVTRWDGGETVYPLREYPGETISFLHEIEHFIDCVRTGAPPEIDVNFGAEIIAVCGAAYLSAIRKRAVTLEEFKEFSRGYVEKYGDNEQAEEALLTDLLAPYRRKG